MRQSNITAVAELSTNLARTKSADISRVEPLIFVVRGQRVMLDEDLARMYGVPIRQLNQQVRRNRARFPDDFMFRLTAEQGEQAAQIHLLFAEFRRLARER